MKRFRNPQTVDDGRDALIDKDGGVPVSLQDMSTLLETFESTFALSPMSIVVADARAVDMPIVYVNQSFLDLTGYTKAYTVGRNCRFLQGEATDPDAVARVRTAIKQRQAVMVELLNYKQDGSFFWTSLSLGPVFNSNGELIFYFASQVDVTAQHLADALTAETEKINALGRVTAGLAHDLNNLLHVMAGNLDRLRTRAEQEPQMLRHVKAAISASDRAATLTQQLLTFSGSGHIYSGTSSLNNLVFSIRLLLSSAAGFDVNVEFDLRDDLPDVYMDDETIRTLLIIYVFAARDHAPKYSTVMLRTSMATLEVGSDQQALERAVRLSIVSSVNVREERNDPDNAPAVGPNTLVNVALLKRMGGHLSVTTTDAGQRRVDMYLPCAKPLVAEGVAVHQIGARRRGELVRARVLVVDDNQDVLNLTEDIMNGLDLTVDVARNGEEALGLVLEEGASPYRLVISDVAMPGGMTGIMFAKMLREQAPNIPLILMTGYSDRETLKELQALAAGVIGKPFKPADLVDLVAPLLDDD